MPSSQSAPGPVWFAARHLDQATPDSLFKASAIVVDHSLADTLPIVSFLTDYQFHVTVADSFADAKARLLERPPTLLITEVRLGEYNGLELVLRGKSRHPKLAAIVCTRLHDPVLQTDAEAMGATFVVKPIVKSEFYAATFRTLFQSEQPSAQWQPIRAPFERRSGERRGEVLVPVDERRGSDRRRDIGVLFSATRGDLPAS